MQIEFIDITTYRGISSDAEHFYAKRATSTAKVQESLLDGSGLESMSYWCDEDVKFMPDREQAEQLCRKDNKMAWGTQAESHPVTEEQIREMIQNGTIRFPSIEALLKQVRKDHPNAVLCFSIHGSRKVFTNWLNGLYETDKEKLQRILDIILLPKKQE